MKFANTMSRPKAQLILFACCIVIAASRAAAQVVVVGESKRSPEEYHRLLDNTRKLRVTLELDKQLYFPNEDATLTVTIANPGATPLEVFEPLSTLTGGINMYAHEPAKPMSGLPSWSRISPHPYGPWGGVDPDAPTAWIFPGQPATKKCIVSDPATRASVQANGVETMSVCHGFQMLEDEGEYQIRYDYGAGAVVGFSVVWPDFQQWTEVRFAKDTEPRALRGALLWTISKDAAPRASRDPVYIRYGRYIRFAVLGYENSHIVIVTVDTDSGGQLRPDPSGKFTGLFSRNFAPFRRIATSTVPITSLHAVADNSENITLTYADQTGRSYTVKLNANRELIP